MSSTPFEDWDVDGENVGGHHDACILQEVPILENRKVLENKTVQRFKYGKTNKDGGDDSHLFSFKGVIIAYTDAEPSRVERWLQDKTRISVAIAPSLIWYQDGDEVSLLSIGFVYWLFNNLI